MVRRLKFIVPVLGLLVFITPHFAFAQDFTALNTKLFSDTIDQLNQTKQEEAAQASAQGTQLRNKLDDANSAVIQAVTAPPPEEPLHPDEYRAAAAMGLPSAIVAVDATLNSVLFNRLRELNGISPQQAGQKIAAYLVDPNLKRKKDGGPILIAPQMFRIFMTSFCDPNGRGGTMRSLTPIKDRDNDGYQIGCGAYLQGGSPTTTGYQSRYAYFGVDPAADAKPATLMDYQRQDITNLPLKPNRLFFDPMTYPIDSADVTADTTNSNPMAPYYYGAFAQALEFLTGFPQDQRNTGGLANSSTDQQAFLDKQRDTARQMLAGYPFALLFSERVGSLNQAATTATAHMLIDKIGPMSADDDALYNHVQNLLQRQNLSMAEYMDLAMYQVPMSPGYLARINKLKGRDIEAEKVWLTAMQTALNYQRNRWLEILAALEAVR